MALALKREKRLTYGDYLKWDDKQRWELIEGVAYDMSPAPLREHQEVLINLATQFANFFKGKNCKVYPAPFDVRLPENEDEKDEDILTVVQPDIVIVCDKSKLDRRGCRGAPDLIVEILSPSTSKKDMKDKYFLYQKHGVKEYWIIYPGERFVTIHKLDENGKYQISDSYFYGGKIKVDMFEGLIIDLNDVFPEEEY